MRQRVFFHIKVVIGSGANNHSDSVSSNGGKRGIGFRPGRSSASCEAVAAPHHMPEGRPLDGVITRVATVIARHSNWSDHRSLIPDVLQLDRLQVRADIQDGCGMRQRADRDVVDTGRRDRRSVTQRQSTGCL